MSERAMVTLNRLTTGLGYLSPAEASALMAFAEGVGNHPTFVNIGAGAGTSGLALVLANPTARVYTVDISPGGPLGGLSSEKNAFTNAGIAERLPNQILGDSYDVGNSWANGHIDLLFIDGNHMREGVRRDIDAWTKHVASGGLVIFHDYGSHNWPEVAIAADEMVGYTKIVVTDTLAVFQKE